MIEDYWQNRTELLLGKEGLDKLQQSHVLIVGLGGVGGYAAEQLVRAGIGELTLVDCDSVHPSNRNRQIIALHSTEGKRKTDVLENRMLDINPDLKLTMSDTFISGENIGGILKKPYDFVIDAIDTLTPKVEFLEAVVHLKLPVVSSMGAGGKLDITQVKVDDIEKSHHCKFAYIVRKYLHRLDIYKGIKVVYSPEPVPSHAIRETDGTGNKRSIVGTISYMPAIFGIYCASHVIKELINS